MPTKFRTERMVFAICSGKHGRRGPGTRVAVGDDKPGENAFFGKAYPEKTFQRGVTCDHCPAPMKSLYVQTVPATI